MRVMGSHAISTRSLLPFVPCRAALVLGVVVVIACLFLVRCFRSGARGRSHQERVAPVVSSRPGLRHLGSLSRVPVVMLRSLAHRAP